MSYSYDRGDCPDCPEPIRSPQGEPTDSSGCAFLLWLIGTAIAVIAILPRAGNIQISMVSNPNLNTALIVTGIALLAGTGVGAALLLIVGAFGILYGLIEGIDYLVAALVAVAVGSGLLCVVMLLLRWLGIVGGIDHLLTGLGGAALGGGLLCAVALLLRWLFSL